MRILIYIVSNLIGWVGLIIAFWYVVRSGKVVQGAFIGWGLSIVCVILVSAVFLWIVAHYDS